MAGLSRSMQRQIEYAESLALAAASILAELGPLAQVARARNDQYSIERLRRIAEAAESIRQRGIAWRPPEQSLASDSHSPRCPTLEFHYD